MNPEAVENSKSPRCKFFLTLLLLFFSAAVYAQQVDCSNNANCNDPFCKYPGETSPGAGNGIEKGCNCFNNKDDDGDGATDKADLQCAQYYGLTFVGSEEGDCSLIAPVGNPFASMAPPIVSGQNTADTQSKVSVGDVDGDGVPDAIITSKWNSEIRVVATTTHTVTGTNYAPGDIKSDYKTTGQGAKIFSGSGGCDPKNLLFEHENLIANIDKTGPAELFAIVSNRGGNPSTPPTCFFLLSLRYAKDDLVPLYDAVSLGPNRPGVFGIADMDGDGKAELYMRDRIYAAETGKLLAHGNGNWDLDITSGPVAVDIDKNDGGKMELVCGTKIYKIPNLSDRNPASPQVMTVAAGNDMNLIPGIPGKAFVKLATDPVEYGEDTHSMCSVADIDNDGFVDVVISGALNSVTGKTAVFYWNWKKQKVSYFLPPDPAYVDGWPWGTGRVNLLDSDNDKVLEMFFVAGNRLFRVEPVLDAFADNINTDPAVYASHVNMRIINDSRSGVVTVTLYDFNNDGQFELVYRDSQELVVVDAATLQTKYWSATCQSHTYTEGPVIADVNGDGGTDICVACNRNNSFDIQDPIQQQALGEVRLFFSSTNSWLPTRKVWNQPGYFVININDNLTLPFPQYDQTTVFSNETCSSNGLSGPQRPLNTFLNQLPYISANGCPVYPSPDLTFYGDDPAQPGVDTNGDGQVAPSVIVTPPICGNTDVKVQFNIINSGLLPITASVPVSFYNGNPTLGPGSSTLLHTTTLNVSLPVGISTLTAPVIFNGPGSQFTLYIVLNNTGFPVAASGQSATDCDLQNNIQPVLVTPTPFTLTAAKIADNTVCTPQDASGAVEVDQIWKGTTQVADWSVYNFQWYTGPAVGPNSIINGATNYNLQNLTAGTYTVIATHKTIAGCASAPVDVVVGETVLSVPYTLNKISDQTQCTPFNGAISANFFGADLAGVTIVWRDANSNEIIDTDVTSISGLKGDVTYQISVTKGGCSSSQTMPLLAPVIPSGIALPERDVMNCLNLQSGKVTARAFINGTTDMDPDTINYKFTWYNSTSAAVRGSLIPNQPTTGPSAWGVPVGWYEVVITDNRTNCTSVDPIAPVEVKEGFTLPVATIERRKPQTSCDPNVGNAALEAIVLENGNPAANQSDYHFFWYAGQNTITKLRTNANTIIDNALLEDVQGGVKGGGQAYTVEVVHKVTGCVDTEFLTAEEIINYPEVTLTKVDNDICPNTLNLAFSGEVQSSVVFAAAAVTDFSNYTFNWYTGGSVNEANRIPNATALTELVNLQGGTFTLQVERTDLKCKSVPVPIQVLDVLAYPVLTPGVSGSANCTTPPTPNGSAFVATVDGQTPVNGVLAPYSFKWYTGLTATPDNEVSGTNNLSVINQLQGSNDPALANFTVSVANAKGCSSVLTIHVPDNRVLPALSLAPSPNLNCAEGNGVTFTGSVQATVTNLVGNISDYTFTWNNVTLGTRTADGAAGSLWDKLNAGSYDVKVLHKTTGCESPVSVANVVNQTVLPVIEADPFASTNCMPNKPGNGHVEVTSVDTRIISNDAAVLTDYAFAWYTGAAVAGAPISNQYNTTSTLQGSPTAFFTVEVRRLSNNCVNSATVQLPDASARPVLTLGQDPNLNCAGFNGAAFVTGITHKTLPYTNLANIQYAWFDGSGTGTPRNPQVNDDRLEGLEGNKFYSATVTMIDEGCTSDFVAIQVQNSLVFPDITTAISGSTNCTGGTPDGSANVTAVLPASTYEYRWYSGNVVGATVINDNVNDTDIAGKQGGANSYFTVEVKNTTTQCASTETVLIPDVSTLPVASLSAVNNPNCAQFPNGNPVTPGGSVAVNTISFQGNPVASPYNGFNFIWVGTGAPAEGPNIPSLQNKPAGVYTLQVRHITTNCVSDLASSTILDAPVYPTIATDIDDQTSCDNNAANGKITPTIVGASVIEWHSGVGLGGSTVTHDPVDGSISGLQSGDYTIQVHNATTGCAALETVFVPNNITYPDLSFVNVNPVQRCDFPDGSATPTISNTSNPQNFTWYRVFTPQGDAPPFDPAVIKAGTATNGNAAGNQAALLNISPGYITAMVRDNNTACESNPETVQIENITNIANISFQSSATAGFCNAGTPTGELRVNVVSVNPIVSYQWFAGSPTNSGTIDFMNNANPPTFAGAAIQFTEDLIGVVSGVYTIVVRDDKGCGNYFIDNVPFTGAPTVTITPTDNTTCDVANPNGSIRVQVTGPATYRVLIHDGNGPASAVLLDQNPTMDVTRPDLDQGPYYIQVIDQTPANLLCPLGFGEVLEQKAFGPLLTLGQILPNTACNGSPLGEGSVTLTATQDEEDNTTADYEISVINPLPSNFVAPQNIAVGVATQIDGFRSTNYTITVRDKVTTCSTNIAVAIPDQPILPQDIIVAVTDDRFCSPLSSGQVSVTNVLPGGVGQYLFNWYDANMNALVTAGPAVFNNTAVNATPGLGNGSHTYYVQGIKNTAPGQGCPTALEMRTINDVHTTPIPALTSRPNTSCLPAIGEGIVTIAASIVSSDPLIQNGTYTYNFNGTVFNGEPGAPARTISNLTNNNGIAYPVQVTNEVNQCITNTTVTVVNSQFGLDITKNTVEHQLICNPDGSITVTEIVMNRSLTGESTVTYNAALTNDFDFQWFKAPDGSPGTFDANNPLEDDLTAPIVTESLLQGNAAGQYSAMEAGTYYVIATRKPTAPGAGCSTPPYQVNVMDQHVNPVVNLVSSANTSCSNDPAFGEGSIVVTVTDGTNNTVPRPFTYSYTWSPGIPMPFPNVNDGDGLGTDNDNDNPTRLQDGTYGITVHNMQTGCEVLGSTTISRNETPVFLTEAVPTHQERCTNDGSIEVTLVEVQHPSTGVQPAPLPDFTFTWTRGGATIQQSTSVLLNSGSYPQISAGTYYVTATRTANPSSDGGPGFGCSSAPYRVDILDRIQFPNITVVPTANTACTDDPDFFEGSAQITITESGVGAGATYEYTWTSADPANTSDVLTALPKTQGLGNPDVQGGLRDDVYTIAVQNLTTLCTVTTGTEIVKTSIPVIITEATSTPKLICDADGSVLVTKIMAGNVEFLPATMNNFDFTWSEETLANTITVLPSAQGASILNTTSYPTITENNSLTYFVSATMRNDALNPDLTEARGRGCSSAPVMVVIQDQSQNPTVSFALEQNTSCNDLSPNGSIIATGADPVDPAPAFIFQWTYDGTLPATTVPFSSGVQNGFTKAPEGVYTLNLENDNTGCVITQVMAVELNESASYPNIIEVIPQSPIDCNNSGSAEVTRIYIGNDSGTEIPGSDARFAYTWYTAYTDATTNTPIAGQIEEVVTNRGPGTYFVTVIDQFEDRNCPSGPNQVTIDDPIENYPVVTIAQTLPQISCRDNEGTAALLASADNGNTGAPYTFSWYTGLDAADGNELLDQNAVQRVGSALNPVDDGTYSVKVYNSVTNCTSTQYFIIEDQRGLFFPELMLSTGPRTSCLLPNGTLGVREVGYNTLNTTDPSAPRYYGFAPNYSADYILGPKEQVGETFDNDMTPNAAFDQSTNRLWGATGLDGLQVYTIRITDENTGCYTIDDVEIPNQQEDPVIDMIVENPLINCYEDQPNGQITATADNGRIIGYVFNWYAGDAVDPTQFVSTGDKLIGVGETPSNPDLEFTVHVTNSLTGCDNEATIVLPDSRTTAEPPTAYTVQDDSRCDSDDGWVTAHVNNETFTHNFYWFNGDVANPNINDANHVDPNYANLGANTYTVVSQDRITGCLSLPITTPVKDISIIPDLIFKVTASYCEDVPVELGGGIGNGTIELTLDPADVISDDIRWTKEVDLTDAGTGNYVTGVFPGFYLVDVTTTKGCTQSGRVEVPTDIRNYNLVTQNGDGKNDKFVIDCISRFRDNNVKIFNRSGVLVYEATNYNNDDVVFEGIGKNGLYMTGNVLPVGTYFYIIDKRDGSRPRTGYLELVR